MKDPAVFIVDYNDGLRAAAFLMTGMVEDFTVAVDVEGQPTPVSTLMNLQNSRPHHHFGCLVKNIEKMFETGKAPYPVERTLMTSGILDFALESRYQGYKKLETPNWRRFVTKHQTLHTSAGQVGDRMANGWTEESAPTCSS